MVIETQGERAVTIREVMLEFVRARCPTSDLIRALAAEAGVTSTRYRSEASPDELCSLCGLCVRAWRDLVGAAAIGFIGRGANRKVGSPFHVQAEACIGCGACATVCPTGAIQIEDVNGQRVLHTWNTRVPLKPCPNCGQPYAPEPMLFLRDLVTVSAELWGDLPGMPAQEGGRAARLHVARRARLSTDWKLSAPLKILQL
jgi:bidirectional [NiFe] hydrogenase diaphorase subunit